MPQVLTRGETVDAKRLDFFLALFVDPGFPREQHGWPGRQRETDPTLAEAIREAVADIPLSVDVNKVAYAPLRYSPIAVGVQSKKGMSNLEEGRRQLSVCTAACPAVLVVLRTDNVTALSISLLTCT
jgi:hypothetical protein